MKCVYRKGFTCLLPFKKHLRTCQAKKDQEKQERPLDEKQIQIIGLLRHLRDKASKKVDQELGIVRGRGRRQQLTAGKEPRCGSDDDEIVEGGCAGDEHELERGKGEAVTLREFIVCAGSHELAYG